MNLKIVALGVVLILVAMLISGCMASSGEHDSSSENDIELTSGTNKIIVDYNQDTIPRILKIEIGGVNNQLLIQLVMK